MVAFGRVGGLPTALNFAFKQNVSKVIMTFKFPYNPGLSCMSKPFRVASDDLLERIILRSQA
jgi:hypothetical protein